MDTNNWFTVASAGSGAFGGSALTNMSNVTVVYFDKPLSYTEGSKISAVVKMTAAGNSGANNGIIMGYMTRPLPGRTPFVHYAGHRVSTNLTRAMGTTRGADFSSAAYSPAAPNHALNDSFIYEVYRSPGSHVFNMAIRNMDGTLITSGTRGAATDFNQITNLLIGNVEIFAGFIVSNATVQISNIVITEGSATLFSTPAPTVSVESVAFTSPAVQGTAGNFTYTHRLMEGDLALTAAVLPAGSPQNIEWVIENSLGATLTGTGNTRTVNLSAVSEDGEITITATAAGTQIKSTLIITIDTAADILVDEITITGNTGVITSHGTQLTATVNEDATNKAVLWSVESGDEYISIDPNTGWVKGIALGSGTVIATAKDESGFSSEPFTITVESHAGKSITWNFSTTAYTSLPWPVSGSRVVGDLTFGDGMNLAANSATIEGIAFTHHLRFPGAPTGSNLPASRTVSFDVAGDCKIEVIDSSGTAGRFYRLNTLSGTTFAAIMQEKTKVAAGGKLTFENTRGATRLYLYVQGGGLDIRQITVIYPEP
jgi:hypothetical protein